MERNLLYGEIENVLANDLSSLRRELPDTALSGVGTIQYVDLRAGEFQFPNSGIFIPRNFQVQQSGVDVILYFHGLIIKACSGNSETYEKLGMKSYLENNTYFESLCPTLSASGKNAILIAVTWMMKSEDGKYKYEGRSKYRNKVSAKEFNDLIESCRAAINRFITIPTNIPIGNIVIAGHSAGGAPMQRIVGGVGDKIYDQRYLSKIKECWGFDSQYTVNTNDWVNWLARNNERVYKHFSVGEVRPKPVDKSESQPFNIKQFIADHHPKVTVPPNMNISNLRYRLKTLKKIDAKRYPFIQGKANHCGMVAKYFGGCLDSSKVLR